jgi:hypothetical protein
MKKIKIEISPDILAKQSAEIVITPRVAKLGGSFKNIPLRDIITPKPND